MPGPGSARALMFQGTGSDVGKSLLVAGLCRAFLNRGLTVAPFKPQNMSNNAAVTADGGEIGRAQALQAQACKLEPNVHMNPVLLKPQNEIGSQLIVQGQVQGTYRYKDYIDLKPKLLDRVLESYHHLAASYDLVLVEGAGSAAEVNLRKGDIANMGFAEAAQIPVILIGDIDRGGVIASLVGTHQLLSPEERGLLKGYLINKFRGDPTLFESALDIIKMHSGLQSFGIVPFFDAARGLPDEDAMSLDNRKKVHQNGALKISVLRYPRIANFDDLDPLDQDPRIDLTLLERGDVLKGDQDLVILPGSKATLADYDFLVSQGWHEDLSAHVRRGGAVLGLCGGYQMLGRVIEDPDAIEGPADQRETLGFFDVETRLSGPKTLKPAQGMCLLNQLKVKGYEMHMGVTSRKPGDRAFLQLNGVPEGQMSADGRIMGTYLHGLFHEDAFRNDFFRKISQGPIGADIQMKKVDDILDDLAHHLEDHCDLDRLLEMSGR